ncbi:MAG: ATP-binding cassette domain-containing protein [Halieaceae bacterium]|jgi:sodium transport system ATP-binding protein|nr:ATP-binding cassette domain-containing protein [Halieaceae bacterium]
MIQVNNISKAFGEIQAVDGASFAAADGQITGILGPNGAGKTTCLRMIYGLLKPDQGQVEIGGVDSTQSPMAAKRQLGVFPDKLGSWERLTTREIIDYFASLHGMSTDKRRSAIDDIVNELDLHEIIDRRTKGFSQGQRMKVGLAACLVHSPQHMLLDEPSRGLDVMASRILRDYLKAQRDAGRCVVFSSHVMQEVAALCDKVVIIAKGKVAAEGTPDALCELAGEASLEDAFVKIIGTTEGIAA